ncbi:OmpA family protein [Frateuria aurantia]
MNARKVDGDKGLRVRHSGWCLMGLLMLGLLAGCAHEAPRPVITHSRFTPQQVHALQSEGFTEQSDGDWTFGMSEKMLFGHDMSTLQPARMEALRGLAHTLLQVGIQHLRVDGYTDISGREKYNVELSRKRAQSVADALVAAGMPSAGISIRGLGAASPVADNRTAEGRAENRRAVLVVSSP